MIHCFWPRIIQPSSVRSAVVRIDPGSLPASGSLSAKAPAMYSPEVKRGTYVARCSGVPKVVITSATMLVTDMVTAVEAQPRATSIIASE